MKDGVLISKRLAVKLKRLPEGTARDLVPLRRRTDVAVSARDFIPAIVTAVYGSVNASYDVEALSGDIELLEVFPHDRVFLAPPAEFDPVPIGSPCFIAKFKLPDSEEPSYYLWSLHEKCRTATCGGAP